MACSLNTTDTASSSVSVSPKSVGFLPKDESAGFYEALQSAVNDAANVVHLLDLAINTLMDMTIPASEHHDHDRLSSLLVVSRDLVEKVSNTWPKPALSN